MTTASSTAPRAPSAVEVIPCPFSKRALDVVLSAIGLVLALPVGLVIAVGVKLHDGGPIFYGQPRIGEGGQVFHAFKFRSMVVDAEARTGAVQATEDDPRVTPIGRLLRASAIDELPQLRNIFRGKMSFVGPRALRPGSRP